MNSDHFKYFTNFIIRSWDKLEKFNIVSFHKPNPYPYLKAIELSGIKVGESLAFEDSNPGIKSALGAKLPTIYIPSNIPTSIDKQLNLDFILDSLGSEENMSKVIKGPKLEKNFVDYFYLEKLLQI